MKHNFLLNKLEMSWHTYCWKMIDTFHYLFFILKKRNRFYLNFYTKLMMDVMQSKTDPYHSKGTRLWMWNLKLWLDFLNFVVSNLLLNQNLHAHIIFHKRKWQNTTCGKNHYSCVEWPHPDDLLNLFQMIFFLSKVSLTELLTGIYRVILKGCVFKDDRKNFKNDYSKIR